MNFSGGEWAEMPLYIPDCSQVKVIHGQEVNILINPPDVTDKEVFIFVLLSDFLNFTIVPYYSVDNGMYLPDHDSHITPLNAYHKLKIVCIVFIHGHRSVP